MAEQTEPASIKKPRVALWIATGFGLGYLPVAPGTWGSLGGVALFCAMPYLSYPLFALFFPDVPSGQIPEESGGHALALLSFVAYVKANLITYIILLLLVSAAGVWAARHAARYFGKSDPGQIVIDEVSGQLISYYPLCAMSFTGSWWKYLLLGFILFRIFDIVKPWPARAAEKWPNGWGIMADDWFAGGYAAIVLWVIRWAGWLG